MVQTNIHQTSKQYNLLTIWIHLILQVNTRVRGIMVAAPTSVLWKEMVQLAAPVPSTWYCCRMSFPVEVNPTPLIYSCSVFAALRYMNTEPCVVLRASNLFPWAVLLHIRWSGLYPSCLALWRLRWMWWQQWWGGLPGLLRVWVSVWQPAVHWNESALQWGDQLSGQIRWEQMWRWGQGGSFYLDSLCICCIYCKQ